MGSAYQTEDGVLDWLRYVSEHRTRRLYSALFNSYVLHSVVIIDQSYRKQGWCIERAEPNIIPTNL